MKKLKSYKKILAVAVSAFMLAILPDTNALTVSAEEPSTFVFLHDGGENDDGWWYQRGSDWNDQEPARSIHFVHEDLKNGDLVVVSTPGPMLTLNNVHLSNLTVVGNGGGLTMVTVPGGIDNCYILNDTQASITGDVTNANVYGASNVTFFNNVTNLYTYNDNPDTGATIGVKGTVAYFDSKDENYGITPHGSNFAANTFALDNGSLLTDPAHYSSDISRGPAAGTTSNAQSTAAPQAAPKSSASDEYDSVPKTGESSAAMWLLLPAAFCFSVSLILRKSSRQ